MGGFWRTLGAILAGVLVAAAAAFAWYGYTPAPKMPVLSAEARTVAFGIGGHLRTAIEYVPPKLPPGAALVIVLHGSSMNGAWMRRWTGYEFDALADRHGFAVFYPDAYKGNWNDCRIVHNVASKREHYDDTAFIRAMIHRAQTQFGVDPKKVFLVGFSNGGHMAQTVATEQPDLVAGIAIFASSLSVPGATTCPQDTPTPRVMIADGTGDPINPFNGGEVNIFGLQNRGLVISAPASAAEFARRNAITAPPIVSVLQHRDAADPTSVRRFTWMRAGKPDVVLYEVIGGGHVVPQPAFRFPRLFGRTSRDLDGPAAAIGFFGL